MNCYIDLLKTSLLPECHRLYPGNDFEFLQDSAVSHRAKVMQQFLRQNTPDFIAADQWPSCSPDLKGKLKRPQSLRQLRRRCITITILHNTACFETR